jgi:hypothetical protein
MGIHNSTGFRINPVNPDWLVCSVEGGSSPYSYLCINFLFYNISTGEEKIIDARPYEDAESSGYNSCWTSDGNSLIYEVQTSEAGDPMRLKEKEIWRMDDIF